MKLEDVLLLIDECKKRGLASLSVQGCGEMGQFEKIEFTIAPGVPPGDALAELEPPKPIDHSKCLVCQKSPQERGTMCRGCWLGQAGVSS